MILEACFDSTLACGLSSLLANVENEPRNDGALSLSSFTHEGVSMVEG